MKKVKALIGGVAFWLMIGAFLLLMFNPAGLLLWAGGFQRDGNTADYFNTVVANAECIVPLPIAATFQSPTVDYLDVQHWALPDENQRFPTSGLFARRLERGQDPTTKLPLYYIEYTEAGLSRLWEQALKQYVDAEPELWQRIRRPQLDFKPGVIIIEALVDLETRQQHIGIILTLNEPALQFTVSGVDMDGMLHLPPTEGPVADIVSRIEVSLNEVLRSARLMDNDGFRLAVHDLQISEDKLQILVSQEFAPPVSLSCPVGWPLPSATDAPEPLDVIQVQHWALLDGSKQFFTDTLFVNKLERSVVNNQTSAYYVEYTEAGLNTLWTNELAQYAHPRQELWQQFSNPTVDLKPGAIVVYADADLGTQQQRVGITLGLVQTSGGPQFYVMGVDVDGELYTQQSAEGLVAAVLSPLEANINEVLRSTRLVEPDGRLLTIREMYIDEGRIQILLRADPAGVVSPTG